jgi:hypothetical protein
MFGHPALHLLIRLKIRAGIRQQVRRLKRPTGWIFMILGLCLMMLWAGGLLFGNRFARAAPVSEELTAFWTHAGLLLLVVMTVIGSFSHRGLYLPKEEIERCFSSPISRPDLVRYRLLINLLRSIFAGVLFGAMTARRMPVAAFGFVGVMVTMLTLPILGQASALLLGDAENRIAKLSSRLPLKAISVLLAVLLVAATGILVIGGEATSDIATKVRDWLPRGASIDGLMELPFVKAVLLPLRPWAAMITASDAVTFFAWLSVCAVIWYVGFELTARIPVDFRELSLATSADVAKKLNRVRRGALGASGGSVSKRTLGWNLPWIFGRGGFGAIAWLKLASIVRKARGTLLVSAGVVALVTMMMTVAFDGSTAAEVVAGAGMLALIGTFYLCAGLRFDFRTDLELMEQIKAWPVRPTLVFLATLLPEVLLVSGALYAGILLRAAFTSEFHPAILAVLALQPLVTLAWVALDNAVFLFSPVRYSPGQEGALQHMGRSVVLMLLRAVLFGIVLIVAGGPAALAYYVVNGSLDYDATALSIAIVVTWTGLLAVDGLLLLLGGKMLQRFDVARDKG